MKKILITGATGLIGTAICRKLVGRYRIVAPVRKLSDILPQEIEQIVIYDLMSTDWVSLLEDVDVVLHCAARVHIMEDNAADPLTEFRRVNVDPVKKIATAARRRGVKRFVFISSIKVNGESTKVGRPFTEIDTPSPQDPYAISKYEAEIELGQLINHVGMEIVTVRFPMVYGPTAKGNFAALARMINDGVPLPLANTGNLRSFLYVDNAAEILEILIERAGINGMTFLASDDDDVSTSQLIKKMAAACGTEARLFPVPRIVLVMIASIAGKRKIMDRLLNSLQVDVRKTKEVLGWTPRFSLSTALI